MKRNIRSLVLVIAVAVAVGAGCDRVGTTALTSRYDLEVVTQMAPECMEAGHDPVVCACTVHHVASATRAQDYPRWSLLGGATRNWPGEANGALARWHTSCETWARALGLVEPHVSSGPPE